MVCCDYKEVNMSGSRYGMAAALCLMAGLQAACGLDRAKTVTLNSPGGVAVDANGKLYVVDVGNSTVGALASDVAAPVAVMALVAGKAGQTGSSDGRADLARFNEPRSIAVDGRGILYVVDGLSSGTIRKISTDGLVTTLAGRAGDLGSADGEGAAASFLFPSAIAVDAAGNAYVTDTNNRTIRKISSSGLVTTLAGQVDEMGITNGRGAAARFMSPRGIVADAAGNLYVSDSAAKTIRKVSPAGDVSTFAGKAREAGSSDGAGEVARFGSPLGLALDKNGFLYVADAGNHTIRKVSATGVVTTLAGSAGDPGYVDGQGSAARFAFPQSLSVDSSGNVYVADADNHDLRKITPEGLVTTVAKGSANTSENSGVAKK